LVAIAGAVRRYKSEHNLSLATGLARLQIAVSVPAFSQLIREAAADLASITRAAQIEVVEVFAPGLEALTIEGSLELAIGY
jgi:hypothetical protein